MGFISSEGLRDSPAGRAHCAWGAHSAGFQLVGVRMRGGSSRWSGIVPCSKKGAAGFYACRQFVAAFYLLGRKRVAMVTHIVVRSEDVRLLLGEKLAEGQGKLLREGILVGGLRLVLALLGGGEKGVVVG